MNFLVIHCLYFLVSTICSGQISVEFSGGISNSTCQIIGGNNAGHFKPIRSLSSSYGFRLNYNHKNNVEIGLTVCLQSHDSRVSFNSLTSGVSHYRNYFGKYFMLGPSVTKTKTIGKRFFVGLGASILIYDNKFWTSDKLFSYTKVPVSQPPTYVYAYTHEVEYRNKYNIKGQLLADFGIYINSSKTVALSLSLILGRSLFTNYSQTIRSNPHATDTVADVLIKNNGFTQAIQFGCRYTLSKPKN